MSQLRRMLLGSRAAMMSDGYRPIRYSDPGFGLEVNGVHNNTRVSGRTGLFDIARTPTMVKGFDGENFITADIHNQAWKANSLVAMISYREHRAKGRIR